MSLFKIRQDKGIEAIREKAFKLERDLQNLTEANLEKIFGFEFIKSEFALNNLRIDTLAFDREANAFVIIEYKRDEKSGAVEQLLSYLGLMRENQADFILELNKVSGKHFDKKDINWDKCRCLLIAKTFTYHQIKTLSLEDRKYELWQVKYYENGYISFEELGKEMGVKNNKKTMSVDDSSSVACPDQRDCLVDGGLNRVPIEYKDLYKTFKHAMLSIDGIKLKLTKKYIHFCLDKVIVGVSPQKNGLKLLLGMKTGELKDPLKLTRDVSSIRHDPPGDYQIRITSDEDLEYIMSLVKQVVNKHRK